MIKSESELSGETIYSKYCVNCHGSDGKLGLNGAKNLGQSILTNEEKKEIITHGKNAMTPFGKILSEAEIQQVTAYINHFLHSDSTVIDTFN